MSVLAVYFGFRGVDQIRSPINASYPKIL